MVEQSVTLNVPDRLLQRLRNTASATQRTLEEVMLRALDVGGPPAWDDVPPEFQADLAAMDRLDDDALWSVATGRKAVDDPAVVRYEELIQRQSVGGLGSSDAVELEQLQHELDRFMLRKAHAAVLLKWRGRRIPAL